MPLIVSVPGRATGCTRSIVELADLYPTLSELAGLEIPTEVQGKSMVPVLSDPGATVCESALTADRGYSIRTADWHYIRYNPNMPELHNVRTDDGQFDNLAEDPQHQSVLKLLDALLSRRLRSAGL